MRKRYPGLDIATNGTDYSKDRGKSWDDALVARAFDEIFNYVSRDYLEAKIEDAVLRISEAKKRYPGKTTIGWSGGKDSLVTERIARIAGYESGVCALYRGAPVVEIHEFAKFKSPKSVEIIEIGPGDEWTEKNKEQLWGPSPTVSVKNLHASAQRKWCSENKSSLHIIGRRLDDGNFCGKKTDIGGVAGSPGYTVSLSPIYDWWHEEIIAAIKYFEIELPSTYTSQYGFMAGAISTWNKVMNHVGRKDIDVFPTKESFRAWMCNWAPKSVENFDRIMKWNQ